MKIDSILKALQEQQRDEKRQGEFMDLPNETLIEIAKKLTSTKDISNLAQTNKRAQGLFKPALDSIAVNMLLEHVVHGEQDEAEKLIKKRPDLLTLRGDITDYSGRTFKNITPFEYALWALDRHMWEIMLKALPDNKNGYEIKQQLFQQYKVHMRSEGVHYLFEGKSYQEKHYDFALKDKLHEYLTFTFLNHQELTNHWIKEVGGAQRMVPCYIAKEYGRSDRSFDPTPQFKEEQLPKNLYFYNQARGKPEAWFSLSSSRLGFNFGIFRGDWDKAYGVQYVDRGSATLDWQALSALCKKNTLEFNELGQRLKSELEQASQKRPPAI
ncbi:SidC homolog (plasmid) [Legionella adelaidensis]|uniref:SidC homolog n=1 Tax=Legionella adelaidensis TaxID=45056 RepID=A0A0W0R2F2_9GAMM|nr:F-box protein [Legionella adelaidensis]KTC65281.1 hypothetical protein Lade_1464 [Legionella adelaidensis]VEH81231.1 SidC homolog [Legionella adelaidensis]